MNVTAAEHFPTVGRKVHHVHRMRPGSPRTFCGRKVPKLAWKRTGRRVTCGICRARALRLY